MADKTPEDAVNQQPASPSGSGADRFFWKAAQIVAFTLYGLWPGNAEATGELTKLYEFSLSNSGLGVAMSTSNAYFGTSSGIEVFNLEGVYQSTIPNPSDVWGLGYDTALRAVATDGTVAYTYNPATTEWSGGQPLADTPIGGRGYGSTSTKQFVLDGNGTTIKIIDRTNGSLLTSTVALGSEYFGLDAATFNGTNFVFAVDGNNYVDALHLDSTWSSVVDTQRWTLSNPSLGGQVYYGVGATVINGQLYLDLNNQGNEGIIASLPNVPEPGTGALMAIGLVGLGSASRRRMQGA